MDEEPSLRVGVITGTGRAFCAGADLKGVLCCLVLGPINSNSASLMLFASILSYMKMNSTDRIQNGMTPLAPIAAAQCPTAASEASPGERARNPSLPR